MDKDGFAITSNQYTSEDFPTQGPLRVRKERPHPAYCSQIAHDDNRRFHDNVSAFKGPLLNEALLSQYDNFLGDPLVYASPLKRSTLLQ